MKGEALADGVLAIVKAACDPLHERIKALEQGTAEQPRGCALAKDLLPRVEALEQTLKSVGGVDGALAARVRQALAARD